MKIQGIRAARLILPDIQSDAKARRPAWSEHAEVANAMSRYPRFKAHRSRWRPPWDQVACVVTAEDGTWGLGMTTHDGPVVPIINDHLAPMLVGEDCMATEKLWDTMFRLTSPYSSAGLASSSWVLLQVSHCARAIDVPLECLCPIRGRVRGAERRAGVRYRANAGRGRGGRVLNC